MKSRNILDEGALVQRGVGILMEKLGPVEARRFLAMAVNKRLDSVKRHRDWQRKLDKKAFFNKVFAV